jgi:hypothetical protein
MKLSPPVSESARSYGNVSNYPEIFVIDNNMLTDYKGLAQYKPFQIEIKNYFRLNGNANPQHNGMVYLIETYDGRRGILIYKFDAFTDSKVYNFLKDYVDYQHRMEKRNNPS